MANLVVIQNEYRDALAVQHVVGYILRHAVALDGYGLSPDYPIICMNGMKRAWNKDSGSRLNHYIFSLSPTEENQITINELLSFGAVFSRFLHEFQTVYAVHANTHHLHLHFVMNTVSFLNTGLSLEAVLDRLPTARVLEEKNGEYTVEAEIFGDGIDMWLRSQGETIKVLR